WEDLDPARSSPMQGGGALFFDAAADRMLRWGGGQLWEITWPFGTPSPFGAASATADAAGVYVPRPAAPTVGPCAAAVDRSTDGGQTWTRRYSVTPAADGSIAFTDADASLAGPAVYRATIERGGQTRVLGTASTVLGPRAAAALALAPPRPNPVVD